MTRLGEASVLAPVDLHCPRARGTKGARPSPRPPWIHLFKARSPVGLLRSLVLLHLLCPIGGCGERQDSYEGCVLQSSSDLEHATGKSPSGHLAELEGIYEVWWVPAAGDGAPCGGSAALRLDFESVTDSGVVFCPQAHQFFDAAKREWVWANEFAFSAHCQFEGYRKTECRVQVPEPAPWLLSGTYLGVELEEGVTLEVQWSTRGEFQFGTIRNAEGTLLGRVCDAPQL